MEHSSLPPQLLLLGLPQVQGLEPTPSATLNQLHTNISREVAQIDPAMVRRAILDMRARAQKCIDGNGGHFEK